MKAKTVRRILKRGAAAAAGTAAVGLNGCDGPITVCDPPPPPLCDSLDLDPALAVSADRTVAGREETILFRGAVDPEAVALESFYVEPGVGLVVEQDLLGPDSLSFRWSPRNPAGNTPAGEYEIRILMDVRAVTGDGLGAACEQIESIRVSIDADGTATVLSLPEGAPLGVYFRLEMEAEGAGGSTALRASSTLPEAAARDLDWRWRCSSGRLEVDGPRARFVPDEAAEVAVVQVEAALGDRGLATAVWHWRRGS